MNTSDYSIIAWILEHQIKTEKGEPLSFKDHMFLYDIYRDFSPYQVHMKAAQVGMSTCQNLKAFFVADKYKMDIAYTLPTDSDVVDFVGSKTNRILQQNPFLSALTADKDTIEQKKVGKNMIYFRGTWTKKAAMMVPVDLLIHDEVDASKLNIIEDYESRLKHSKFKWKWYFSHPSTEGAGVHKHWIQSDQKHWFIKCEHCNEWQYLSWPDSIDQERGIYACKQCRKEITDKVRSGGEWIKKFDGKEYSGYWISSLVCPWVPAAEIVKNHKEKDAEYFATKVLGIPYIGQGNKVTQQIIFQNIKREINDQKGRIVIGVDTGARINLVCSNEKGLFYYSETEDYTELESLMRRWPRAIVVIDQGGDIISPRKLREKYPGRVFLCHFRQDRKTFQLIRWGKDKEFGNVVVDRNRMIQLVVDEFTDKRWPIWGNETDWQDYFTHWNNMYRVKEDDALGVPRYEWKRSGPDHWALATIYCRVGLSKYMNGDGMVMSGPILLENVDKGIEVAPDNTAPAKGFIELPRYDDSGIDGY